MTNQPPGTFLLALEQTLNIKYLSPEELLRLYHAYWRWFEEPEGKRYRRRDRARHWLIFLFLRFTGARVSEVLSLNDTRDVDFREGLVRLPILKRHVLRKKGQRRNVPVPSSILGELGRILAEFPGLRGRIFSVHRSAVFRHFRARAQEAGLPQELRHPHVLRHTRAIEMLRAGVPVTVVQEILGHASLTTTAIYLRFSAQEIKTILRDRGLI